MRPFLVMTFVALVGSLGAFAEPSTNEFSLFKHQSRHEAYEWWISEARLLATPEWRSDREKVPLAPDKAWRIGRAWLKRRGFPSPELNSITLRRLATESSISNADKRWLTRFFYRIDCVPAMFDTMVVVVLMDGTVVEPRLIPSMSPEELRKGDYINGP